MNSEATSAKKLWLIVTLILAVAMILSLLSLHTHISVHKQAGLGYTSPCDISETINCSKVELSEWSRLGGVPLAALGFGFYAALLFAGLFFGPVVGLQVAGAVGILLVPMSLGLFYIAKFVVGSVCLFCLGTYLCNILIFLVPQWRGGSFAERVKGDLQGLSGLLKLEELPKTVGVVCLGLGSVILSVLIMQGVVGVDGRREELSELKKAGILDELKVQPKVDITVNTGGEVIARDFVLGPDDAAIEVVEFADYQCPACQHSYGMFRRLVAEYAPHVKFVFRNYPLDKTCNSSIKRDFHQYACRLAHLARCAGEQGKFFSMSDNIMLGRLIPPAEDQGFTKFIEKTVPTLNGVSSIDMEALQECMDSNRHQKKIKSDVAVGNALNITGTPTVFLNRWKLTRTDEQSLREYIEALLREKGIKQ